MSEFSVKSLCGEALHTRVWNLPKGKQPKALVFIIHGLGDHSGAYDELATFLNSKNILVFSHDNIGHGRSPGVRVRYNSMDEIVEPVLNHVGQIKTKYPGYPLFLFGHSLGGLSAVLCARKSASLFKGVILSSPALDVNPALAPTWKIYSAKFLAFMCPDSFVPGSEFKAPYISTDVEAQSQYASDPLIFKDGMRSKTGIVIINEMIGLREFSADFPFLAFHAEADMLTFWKGTQNFYDRASTADKTFKKYDNYGHQLYCEVEPVRSEVKNLISDWILARL